MIYFLHGKVRILKAAYPLFGGAIPSDQQKGGRCQCMLHTLIYFSF